MSTSLNGILSKLKKPKESIALYGMRGSSKALLAAYISKQNKRPVVVVTHSFEKAEHLRDDLSFFMKSEDIYFFPHWDTLPYDNFSPHSDIVSERFLTLNALCEDDAKVIITSPTALMQRIMPVSSFEQGRFQMECGKSYPRKALHQQIQESGYVKVDTVEERGECCFLEEIIDIFPMNAEKPLRLEMVQDELFSIKELDVQTQLSEGEALERMEVLPGREVLLTEESIAQARKSLKSVLSGKDKKKFQQTEDLLKSGTAFAGIESMLSLFYKKTATLFDYLDNKSILVLDEPMMVEEKASSVYNEIFAEYELNQQQENFVLPPEKQHLSHRDVKDAIQKYVTINCNQSGLTESFRLNTHDCPFLDNQQLRQPSRLGQPDPHSSVAQVIQSVKQWQEDGATVVFTSKNQTHADHFQELLSDFDISASPTTLKKHKVPNWANWFKEEFALSSKSPKHVPIVVGPLTSGFHAVNDDGKVAFALLTEEEIFGEKAKKRRLKKNKIQSFMGSLDDLKEGDHVVHLDYGIGQYHGLNKIEVGGQSTEFMVLTYARDEKVYVPIDKFHLIQKYVNADGGRPRLNKLGEKSWKKAKTKVAKAVEDMSEELVEIYAARQSKKGFQYSKDNHLMTEFELGFPFEETEDQLTVIQEVKDDLESEQPMDRLVCGDVGFGKTEIAIRAAFKTVMDSRQVCMLVPTTILAQQHFNSFTKRMDGMPVRVGVISRFRTPSEQRATLKQLEAGELDILIGTHRLLSADVKFSNLGLLVVDEEQRFGVRHKEKIKRFRANVDVLTLSATPIPRTLHMSMMGIRDLSLITTPPPDRLAVRTRFLKSSDHIIQEAVSREVRRKGQVFVVHNRIESIFEYTNYLRRILPDVRIGVGHGQMSEHELERVMVDFIKGEFDVFVSTTIIESGLDIPRANTMIVSNAHQFGLSQLYQLRGRVGRSNMQAYAYLLVPPDKILSNVAEERLKVLQELNDLGVGFKIASRDLELRGAGNLLGGEQSGHIASVGMELYTQLIDDAVKKLQSKQDKLKLEDIKISFGVDTAIPEVYIPKSNQRLSLYKKLAAVSNEDELWKLRDGTENRFGHLPDSVVNLFKTTQARLIGQTLGLKNLEHRSNQLKVQIGNTEKLNTEKLVQWLQIPETPLRFVSEDTLVRENVPATMNEILEGIRGFAELFVSEPEE